MQKLHCVIRHTNESTLKDCRMAVKALGLDYSLISNELSLEAKTKELLGGKYKADWIIALDADVILYRVPEIKSDLFSFTGKLWCTKRGIIDGLHFYDNKRLQEAYYAIKDIDFNWHEGREEHEICQYLNKKGFRTDIYNMNPIGVHLFGVNNET